MKMKIHQKHEEDEEHIGDEKNWTKDSVCSLKGAKVEVAKNGTKQCEH